MSSMITVAPSVEPVTLQEAKDHLEISDDLHDSKIELMIRSAREKAETITQRSLITRTVEHVRSAFADQMCLPFAPLIDVSNIAYIDSDGAPQTLATSIYDVDNRSHVGSVRLAYGESWPSVRPVYNAITITYTAGYGANAQDIPAPIRSAMLLMIGHLFEDREEVSHVKLYSVPMGARNLLAPYRMVTV